MRAIAEETKLIDINGTDELNEVLRNITDLGELISFASKVKFVEDTVLLKTAKAMFMSRAKDLGDTTLIRGIFAEIHKQKEAKKLQRQKSIANAKNDSAYSEGRVPIDLTDKGQPQQTVENFVQIMEFDSVENDLGWSYSDVRFNEVANCPEIFIDQILPDGKILPKIPRRWTDADEAESKHYIEQNYCGLYNDRKHSDALRILFEHRRYNPVTDSIKAIEWDGKSRIYDFLIQWANAEDCAFTRECSRLMFAGGINRAFRPGCKLDDVIVLQGHQGDGKSSLVAWLAILDAYYGELKTIEGKEAVEQTMGKWVCELSELSALTKAKEVEAVKAFISRQKDNYRTPYDKHPVDRLRRCVFVGTTNNPRFLVDLTGNRRFYPVETHCNGYELYRHEDEIREYIKQCWAEMYKLFLDGSKEAQCFAKEELLSEYKRRQADATQDDWRVGAIEDYLSRKTPGSHVCVKELMNEVVSTDKEHPQNPTPKDSKDITNIMTNFEDWERCDRFYTKDWGQQRGWVKTGTATPSLPQVTPSEPQEDPLQNSEWETIPHGGDLPF